MISQILIEERNTCFSRFRDGERRDEGEKPKGEETGFRESIRGTIGGIEVPDDEVTTSILVFQHCGHFAVAK